MHRSDITLGAPRALLVSIAAGLMLWAAPSATIANQDATPTPSLTCANVLATPTTEMHMGAMHGSTPGAHGGMQHAEMPDIDLAYMDMMMPHHESIIALARVALPELQDERLVKIAESIIASQASETQTMSELRARWYGDAEPVSMDAMMQLMPGMGTDPMKMEQEMSAQYQVQTFCSAENKDLAFIDLVIPHHQMAIDGSRDVVGKAMHPEVETIAEDVITAQEAEIVELQAIRAELTGEATPAS